MSSASGDPGDSTAGGVPGDFRRSGIGGPQVDPQDPEGVNGRPQLSPFRPQHHGQCVHITSQAIWPGSYAWDRRKFPGLQMRRFAL